MKLKKQPIWMNIIYGCLMLVVGILTVVFAVINKSVVDQVISLSLAVSLFVIGLTYLSYSLAASTNEFFTTSILLGTMSISLGIVLCVKTSLVTDFVILFVAALLVTIGVVSLIKMIIGIRHRIKTATIIGYATIATLGIVLGILSLVYSAGTTVLIYVLLGVSLIVSSIVEIVVTIRVLKDRRAVSRAMKK